MDSLSVAMLFFILTICINKNFYIRNFFCVKKNIKKKDFDFYL